VAPFWPLCMYIQLEQAFGWAAFQDVFEEYRKLPPAERPKNDDEKRDQWMERLSRRVGKNLGPFFQAWGVPTSDDARSRVAELPKWLPENFPPKSQEQRPSKTLSQREEINCQSPRVSHAGWENVNLR
jgi:hypothetical protein